MIFFIVVEFVFSHNDNDNAFRLDGDDGQHH